MSPTIFRSSVLFDFQHIMPKIGDETYIDFTQNSIGFTVDMASPRFIKSHLPFNLLPEKLQQNELNIKVIFFEKIQK